VCIFTPRAVDWLTGRRSFEERINSFSNYVADIEHDGVQHKLHFMGLFSENKDAQPIIMTHGWPGIFFSPALGHFHFTELIPQDPS
jgi:microsomal epoxide hydrolase